MDNLSSSTLSFDVVIENTGERYRCAEDKTLLQGMESLGKRGIPVGCRNGGCGICKVQVMRGEYRLRPMSRAHVSEEEQSAGQILACRALPASDVSLAVLGQLKQALNRPPKQSQRSDLPASTKSVESENPNQPSAGS